MKIDLEKLQRILESEVSMGVNIGNLTYYANSPMYERILADYNSNIPTCYKISNNLKHRKMLFQKIKRMNSIRRLNTNTVSNNIPDELISLQNVQISGILENNTLENNSEEGQILQNRQNSRILTEDEKSAMYALLMLNGDKQLNNGEAETKEISFLQTEEQEEILSSTKLSENQENDDFSKVGKIVAMKLDEHQEKKLFDLYHDYKLFVNGMFDKTIQAIVNTFNNMNIGNTNNFEGNKNNINDNFNDNNGDIKISNNKPINKSIESLKEDSNKTLDTYETSNNSINVSKFLEYRKKANPKEKRTRNVIRGEGKRTKPIRKFAFSENDCRFKLDPAQIFDVKDEPELKLNKNKKAIDYIRERYKLENNVCILSFYDKKILKNSYLGYFKCKFPDCCTFRFKISREGDVIVDRSGVISHAKDQKYVEQMRGPGRYIAKKETEKNGAYLARKNQILKASDYIAKSGNKQYQKLATLRKVKSEGNQDKCYDQNPFVDVYYMQQGKYKKYIQHLSSPFTIYLWTAETFKVLNTNPQILKDSNFTIHLDASGESVRKIECAEKRVLTYKMSIRIKKLRKILVVAEAILSRHTHTDIVTFLRKLRLFCLENKFKWPFFQRVCTDVSFAIIGATLECCNNQDVSEYIMNCYKFLISGNKNEKPKVIIQWCKCHYMHIMCKDLDKIIGRKHILRNLLKINLRAAYELKTMEECKIWFKHIFIVLLYPAKNKVFYDSFNMLKHKVLDDDENLDEYEIIDEEELSKLDTMAMRSPFRKVFEEIFNRIKKDIEASIIKGPTNEFQNEEVCIFFVNKYCAFANFWTNMMGYTVDPSGDLISNAPAEHCFYLQKNILLKDKSVRPGYFIKVTRKDNASTLKEIRHEYNMFFESDEDEAGGCIILDKNKPEEQSNIERIEKEHPYNNIIEYLEPEELEKQNPKNKNEISDANVKEKVEETEDWDKVNLRKRKAINPKKMLNAKKYKKIIKKSKDIEDIISKEGNEMSRLNKEHSYKLIDSVNLTDSVDQAETSKPPEILYYLYRYDNLYNKKYVHTLDQMDIGFFNILDYREWVTLEKNTMITNFILDIAILCILTKHGFSNAISLPCQRDKIDYRKVEILMNYNPNFIIIPIVSGLHFTLCILNITTHEFLYFDSMFDNSGKDHYDRFLKDSKTDIWKFISIQKRQKQADAVSCGIFVILFIIRFLKGESYYNLGNIHKFKESLKLLLRSYSDDISLFCCHCGNLKRHKTKCLKCNYRVCIECIQDINKYNNKFKICKICTNKIKV